MNASAPPLPDHQEALLRLIAAGGASAPRRALLSAHGCPAQALAAGPSAWRAAGLGPSQADALRNPGPAMARARDWLQQPGHHLIGWHDSDYPALLRDVPSPPLALFVAGNPDLLWHPAVAIVGSRAATAGGHDTTRTFSRAFVAAGLSVISGLALGIDASAHEATLQAGGHTVAVLGSAIDQPYPRAHAGLLSRIAATGAVVSEYLPGTTARREHFPSRNRIVAGLALGTLVVEAAHRSGALITARLAAEAGREVLAIPGSIHNPMTRGCHRLIRDGAGLAEHPDDVLALLAPVAQRLAGALRARLGVPIQGSSTVPDSPGQPATHQPPDHDTLWHALGHDPTGMDQLVERTGLTVARLSSILLLMELEGRVVATHGRYSRRA